MGEEGGGFHVEQPLAPQAPHQPRRHPTHRPTLLQPHARTADAFAVPLASNNNARASANARGVSVSRCGGGLGLSITAATRACISPSNGEPGNNDAM